MYKINNCDSYISVSTEKSSIKIGKTASVYEVQIANNNEEMIYDNNVLTFTFKYTDTSYLTYSIYNIGLNFIGGYDKYSRYNKYFSISDIQHAGESYTESRIECSEDDICFIKYSPAIIKKIKQQINLFLNNKLNVSLKIFLKILSDNNILFNINKFRYYKINDEIVNISLLSLFD